MSAEERNRELVENNTKELVVPTFNKKDIEAIVAECNKKTIFTVDISWFYLKYYPVVEAIPASNPGASTPTIDAEDEQKLVAIFNKFMGNDQYRQLEFCVNFGDYYLFEGNSSDDHIAFVNGYTFAYFGKTYGLDYVGTISLSISADTDRNFVSAANRPRATLEVGKHGVIKCSLLGALIHKDNLPQEAEE